MYKETLGPRITTDKISTFMRFVFYPSFMEETVNKQMCKYVM